MSRKRPVEGPTNDSARPRRPKERLRTSVLEELWSIWRADPRVPSIRSRRSWAVSRNANPRLVDNWFLRRRTCAKRAGIPIPDDTYDLPSDPPFVSEREQSAISVKRELEAVPDLCSDDTLVYPPDIDYLSGLDASSDTVFDEDTLTETKGLEIPAYKGQFHPEYSHPGPRDSCKNDALLFQNAPFPLCNQGQGDQSDFTCIRCLSESAQDTIKLDACMMSNPNLVIPCSRLDFSPGTLSELSAIPFIFRTPSALLPDSPVSYQSLDDWVVVEEELRRLVSDGELDFSFLAAPHLTSMELID